MSFTSTIVAAVLEIAVFVSPGYSIDFVTVGQAGNRPSSPGDVPNTPWVEAGAVPYEYGITRTEVLVEDWLPFVRAYAPFWDGDPGSSALTSGYIYRTPGGSYEAYRGFERHAIDTTWHLAARYVNWLHNGRGNEQSAFENGAYDTSTFHRNADGSWNDQVSHARDVRYWIPSFDEMFKAFYYDPSRYGAGIGGYWTYPNSSDIAPIPGPPGIGTTNAGLGYYSEYGASGIYQDITTPWGLLGASGGMNEFSESVDGIQFRRRFYFGTRLETPMGFVPLIDRIDWFRGGEDPEALLGFRVATVVPGGSSIGVFTIFGLFSTVRSRNGKFRTQ